MYYHCLDCNKDIHNNTDFCPYCGGYLVIENESVADKYGLLKDNKKERGLLSFLYGSIRAYSEKFVYPLLVAVAMLLTCYQGNLITGIFGYIEVFFISLWFTMAISGYETYNEYAFRSEFTSFCFIICIICRLIINL